MGYAVSKFYDAYDGLSYDYYSTSFTGYINNCRKYWGWKNLKYLHITKLGARLHCNRLNKRLMKKMKLKNLLPLLDCYYEVKDCDNKSIFNSECKLDGYDDCIVTSIKTDDGYEGPVMIIYIWRV